MTVAATVAVVAVFPVIELVVETADTTDAFVGRPRLIINFINLCGEAVVAGRLLAITGAIAQLIQLRMA